MTGESPLGPVEVRSARPEDAPFAARLHASQISDGFLSSLGPRFLRPLYRRIMRYPGLLLVDRRGRGPTRRFRGRIVGRGPALPPVLSTRRPFGGGQRAMASARVVASGARDAPPRSVRRRSRRGRAPCHRGRPIVEVAPRGPRSSSARSWPSSKRWRPPALMWWSESTTTPPSPCITGADSCRPGSSSFTAARRHCFSRKTLGQRTPARPHRRLHDHTVAGRRRRPGRIGRIHPARHGPCHKSRGGGPPR